MLLVDSSLTARRAPRLRAEQGRSSHPADPLPAYLREMARIPVPPPEEQERCSTRLCEIRDRLRRLVFESPTAAVEAVRMAGPQSPTAGRLQTLLAAWRLAFDRLWWGNIDPAEVAEIRRTMDQYRQRCAGELEGRGLSPKTLHEIVGQMKVLSTEMDSLLRGLDALREESSERRLLESRRRQLMSLALENARDLHARVASIQRTLRDYDEVKHQIAAGHLRLVVLIARKYVRSGVPLVDLIQEGNLGLLKAVDFFDPGLGFKFSTYSKWWIRESITRGVSTLVGPLRVPVGTSRLRTRLRRTAQVLTHRLGRTPSTEEVAREAGISPGEALRALRTLSGWVSLEAPYGPGRHATVGDLIEDKVARSPTDPDGQKRVRTRIAQALQELSERDRRVIELRFGLGRHREATRSEVARSFELCPERIRQIEAGALERLRSNAGVTGLRTLL